EFDPALPEADLGLYIEVPDGVGEFLPASFKVTRPQLKTTLMGKTVLVDFGEPLTIKTPARYADYIDVSLDPVELEMPAIDLDMAMQGELREYTPTGDEYLLDLSDDDQIEAVIRDLLRFIPNDYHLSDPRLAGSLFGITFGEEATDRFKPITIPLGDIAPELANFSLSELLPASVFDYIAPYVDTSSSDGTKTVWVNTADEADVEDLATDDLVAWAEESTLYRYIGDETEPDLAAVDFEDETRWEIALEWQHTIIDGELDRDDGSATAMVKKGDYVAIVDEKLIYRYLGDTATLKLAEEDFSNTARWAEEYAPPVELTLPLINFGTIGGDIDIVNDLLDLIQIMPSQVRLFNPSFTATVFGQELNREVPLAEVVKKLGIDFLTAGTVEEGDEALPDDEGATAGAPVDEDAIAVGDEYISFSLLEIFPKSVQKILGYFIDKDSGSAIDLRIPPINFGTIDMSTLASGAQELMSKESATGTGTTTGNDAPVTPAPDANAGEEETAPSDWTALTEATPAEAGVSEVQAITLKVDESRLPQGPEAPPATFVLALDSVVTGPIEALVIGDPLNEVQTLSITKTADLALPPVPQVASSYQLTISLPSAGTPGSSEKFMVSVAGAAAVEDASVNAAFTNIQSTQPREIYSAIAKLLGLQPYMPNMLRNTSSSSGGVVTTVSSEDLLVRAEVSSSRQQVFTIELSAAAKQKLGNGTLSIDRLMPRRATASKPIPVYSMQAKAAPAVPAPALDLGYTVALDGRDASVRFIAPDMGKGIDLGTAMRTNASALQSALENLVGKGNVAVTNGSNTSSAWNFEIEFKDKAQSKNIGQLRFTANEAATGRLKLSADTLTDGTKGATAEQQAALIQEALDAALGAGSVSVDVDGTSRYRLSFAGDKYSSQDIAQIRATEMTPGVNVSANTTLEGVAAKGPAYLLETAALTGYGSFSVEIAVDGVTYLSEGISTVIDAVGTRSFIAAAKREAVEAVDEHQRLTIKPGKTAAGKTYTLSSDGGQSATLTFAGDAAQDAAAIQAAIEAWYGAGIVTVTHDEQTSTDSEWMFDILFQEALAATDVLQISASTDAAASVLDFDAETVAEGVAAVDADTLESIGIQLTFREAETTAGSGWIIGFEGALDAHTVESVRIQLLPDEPALPELPAVATRPMAVGGVVVRNDVRGSARAAILRALVEAGSVNVSATDEAIIKANVDSTAEASGGEGEGLAVGGVIATNLVLSTAEAWIEDSAIDTTEGDLIVEGMNSAHIVARNSSAMTSDGTSIGATLAFNTVGWEAQNVLFSAIDALVGSQIGDEQPAKMRAYIKNSDINAAGNVTVDAQSEAFINAFLSNETRSEMATALGVPDAPDTSSSAGAASSAASAGSAASGAAAPKAKGLALGFVLTSNMVSSRAESFIVGEGREINTEDGSLSVTSSDDARVISKINLESVADGEESESSLALKALVNYVGINYTDRSGEQKLKIGDRVRVADADYDSNDRPDTLTAGDRVELKTSVGGGEADDIYEYLGDDEEDVRLDEQDYTDTSLWKRVQGEAGQTYIFKGKAGESELADEDYTDSDRWFLIDVSDLADVGYAVAGEIGAAKVGASAFGGLVVRNDARSDVKSYIEDQTLAITGDITVTATEAATIAAIDTSTVAAADLGLNVVIATNTIMGSTQAWMARSEVSATAGTDTAGDTTIAAENKAVIQAEIDSSIKASTSVGITLAFNTIGYAPQNLLYNAID
ncbi:MAG: hypothetical protein FJY48_12480, partial [Betaproteobacteria bacterium]|nr:hypothetical protein [Betaproteobacteria bacterium]